MHCMLNGVSGLPNLFQAIVFSKGYNVTCAKGVYTTLMCLQYVPMFC